MNNQILRGGCWDNYDYGCRLADRHHISPDYHYDNIGFRLVVNRKPFPTRVLRGGSWISYDGNCRLAHRLRDSPEYRGDSYGFRLVMENKCAT